MGDSGFLDTAYTKTEILSNGEIVSFRREEKIHPSTFRIPHAFL